MTAATGTAENEARATQTAGSGEGAAAYGDSLADVYDLLYPRGPEIGQLVDFVHGVRPAPASLLELGVGTGRLAVPLAERGYRVHGMDASPRMLEKLAENDTTGSITSSAGDFAATVLPQRFDVVLIALNTLFMLPGQEQQIDCLRGIRRQLADGGAALVEVYDPMVFHGPDGSPVQINHLRGDALLVDTVQVDRMRQTALVVHTIVEPGAVRKVPEVSRYAWPAEFRLMARLAGLRLTGWWSDWRRSPVTADTGRHVYLLEADDA